MGRAATGKGSKADSRVACPAEPGNEKVKK